MEALWAIIVVNVGINSLLAFFSSSFLILIALKLLRIQEARWQALCLLLPFIKLVFDLSSYQFSNWALAQQINPLTCPEGTRILSLELILQGLYYPFCYAGLFLEEGQSFTVADILCLTIGSTWTTIGALLFIAGTVGSIGYGYWHYHLFRQWREKLLKNSTLYQGQLSSHLQTALKRQTIKIYVTSTEQAPCITGQWRPLIFLPQMLVQELTQQELEAIIVHEMAHVYQKDLFFNVFLFWVCHLFWWIPIHFIKKRLELAQEYACDRYVIQSNIESWHLANALYKASCWLYPHQKQIFAKSLISPCNTAKRIQALLAPTPYSYSRIIKGVQYTVLIGWMILVFFGKFWTF